MYWVIIRDVLMLTLVYISPEVKQLIPSTNHIGLLKWFSHKVVYLIYVVLYYYSVISLVSQIIFRVYYIIRKKNVHQNKLIRIHNTYIVFIIILLTIWLDYSITNDYCYVFLELVMPRKEAIRLWRLPKKDW